MNKIKMIWPTGRPEIMKKTYKDWMRKADHPERVSVSIAVDTPKQRSKLPEFRKVIVTGKPKCGVVAAVNALTERLNTSPGDIIILVSDDFFPPEHWDTWIDEQFVDFSGCLVVKDGYQIGGCVTIPILDHACFQKLNRIIYHPSYFHQFSDAELWQNVHSLGLIKNFRRKKGQPIFEHRHWVNGKRKHDSIDANMAKKGGIDNKNYRRRMRMPVHKRIQP